MMNNSSTDNSCSGELLGSTSRVVCDREFKLIWTLNDSFRSVPGPVYLQVRPHRSPDLPPGGYSDGTLVSKEVKNEIFTFFSDHVTGEMLDFNLFISNVFTFFSPKLEQFEAHFDRTD